MMDGVRSVVRDFGALGTLARWLLVAATGWLVLPVSVVRWLQWGLTYPKTLSEVWSIYIEGVWRR